LPPIPDNTTEKLPKTLDNIMRKLEYIEKGENAIAEYLLNNLVPLKSSPSDPPPPQNKPHPPPTPPQEERKPHPPPPQNKPHPPPTHQQKPSKPALNEKIMAIQKLYHVVDDVQKNLAQIIIDHMRCIEQFKMTGEEKKTITLNSLEVILLNNKVANIDFIINLSSQLIDVFIAFDKDEITIEQRASALACFACK